MKTCPVCKARCFDDMEVCYGCLYRFRENGFAAPLQPENQHCKAEDPFQGERDAIESRHVSDFDMLPAVSPVSDGSLPAISVEGAEERAPESGIQEETLSIDGAGYRLMVDIRFVPLGESSRAEKGRSCRREGREVQPKRRMESKSDKTVSSHQKKRSGVKQQRKTASHRRSPVCTDPKDGSGVPGDRDSRRTPAS